MSTPTNFLSRRSRLFGLPNSLVILMVVFFALPFALRGARTALNDMENKVTDWLPSEFPETKRLAWFRRHFVGEEFVLITWDGCREDADSYKLFVKRLRDEIADGNAFETELVKANAATLFKSLDKDKDGRLSSEEAAVKMGSSFAQADITSAEFDDGPDGFVSELELENHKERLRARRLGDKLGLHVAGDYNQNWGGQSERWLRDDKGLWYYIIPDGSLYRWAGRPNVLSGMKTFFKRSVLQKKVVEGELIDQFTDKGRKQRWENSYYNDPNLVTARYFRSVRTGPDVVAELTQSGGSLRPRTNISEKKKARRAHHLAMQRLTGSLFGPAVPKSFGWTADEFFERIPKLTQDQLPKEWRTVFAAYIKKACRRYGGDVSKLSEQTVQTQSMLWDRLFDQLDLNPPPRQTCIMVTLSEAGKRDLKKVLGRGLLGQPSGKIVYLAQQAGIDPPPQPPISPFVKEPPLPISVIRMGGPPVDNVAIDEEGQVTLVRLVGFSAILGLSLSLLCFRSVKVTLMLFFVGGVSAIASLGLVCYLGGTVDAILMSMPSLVYVLGLSGSIHIVNYYRDAVTEQGVEGAAERAVRHGWWPCTLAALTTSLGLFSLCRSNIVPISKFGFYSALGVLATVVILFAYLPSAMSITPPRFRERRSPNDDNLLTRFWLAIGRFVVRRHMLVMATSILIMVVVGIGLTKVRTEVQLLKLFDQNSKVIRDYRWLENNFGKLVPMELVVQMPQDTLAEKQPKGDGQKAASLAKAMSLLDRMELASLVQQTVEKEFGEVGRDIMGPGMSAATFAPTIPSPTYQYRQTVNRKLLKDKTLLPADYFQTDSSTGDELWRVSLRMGALNDVDYGEIVDDLKLAVNPVLAAYHYRTEVLTALEKSRGKVNPKGSKVVVLGANPYNNPSPPFEPTKDERWAPIEQKRIFAENLYRLMLVRGFRTSSKSTTPILWHDPEHRPLKDWKKQVQEADCVVIAGSHSSLDLDEINKIAKQVIVATNLTVDQVNPLTGKEATDTDRVGPLHVTYTGVVPIVFRTQRTLLTNLMDSIGWAFVMIAIVMMLLLRYARSSLFGVVNVGGGLASMIPNVFPVVLIFGAMGHLGVFVDIGSMMTASVAMGVAVDDTIHFLTWYRGALEEGQDRSSAIATAYRRVSAAMTQTTLIGGLGLSVFAFSTFTPTQKFGMLMLALLAAALIGDLILLPALLASPLGKLFEPRVVKPRMEPVSVSTDKVEPAAEAVISGPHTNLSKDASLTRRRDPGHS